MSKSFLVMLVIICLQILASSKATKISPMVIVKGSMVVSPPTLNNDLSTYFIAYEWAKTGKSFEDWIHIVTMFKQFYDDYNITRLNWDQVLNFRLANDWNIFGDSISLYQFKAVGEFNPQLDQPFKLYSQNQQFLLSKKIGYDKAVNADVDIDSQFMGKIFGLKMTYEDDISIKFLPFSHQVRDPYVLNIQYLDSLNEGFKVDWWKRGNMVRSKTGKIKHKVMDSIWNQYSKIAQQQNQYKLLMKLIQYRHNKQTKDSQIRGYLTVQEQQFYKAGQNDWRRAGGRHNFTFMNMGETSIFFYFKEIQYGNNKKGLLIDISDVSFQNNDAQKKVVYPKMNILLFQDDQKYRKQIKDVDAQKILNEQGGLLLVKDYSIPDNVILAANISYVHKMNPFADQDHKFFIYYEQNQFDFKVIQRVLYNQPILDNSTSEHQAEKFENLVEGEIYCKHFGKPWNGTKIIFLSQFVLFVHRMDFKGNFQKMIDQSKEFFKLDQKIDKDLFIDKIFKGKENFDFIVKSHEYVEKYAELNPYFKTRPINYRSKTDLNHSIQIQFHYEPGQQIPKGVQDWHQIKYANFVNGVAKFKLKLNMQLSDQTNPRHPVRQSFVVIGRLRQYRSLEYLKEDAFTTFFHQNRTTPLPVLSDWKTNIGPFMRMNALIYPAMQRRVNMYDYQSIMFDGFRRAFEVQDINDVRYMPSTRDMPVWEHRQIRKWLFQPFYDIEKCKSSLTFLKAQKQEKRYLPFDVRKGKLIQLIKSLWSTEINKITMLSSFIFQQSGKNEHKVKHILLDKVKHVAILSNLLVSLGQNPQFDKVQVNFPWKNQFDFTSLLRKDSFKGYLDQFTKMLLNYILLDLPLQSPIIKIEVSDKIKDKNILKNVKQLNDFLSIVNEQKQSSQSGMVTLADKYAHLNNQLWALKDLNEKELFKKTNYQQVEYLTLEYLEEIFDFRGAMDQLVLLNRQKSGETLNYEKSMKSSHFLKLVQIYTGAGVASVRRREVNQEQKEQYFFIQLEEKSYNRVIFNKIIKKMNLKTEQKMNYMIGKYLSEQILQSTFRNQFKELLESVQEIYSKPGSNSSKSGVKAERLLIIDNIVSIIRRMQLLVKKTSNSSNSIKEFYSSFYK